MKIINLYYNDEEFKAAAKFIHEKNNGIKDLYPNWESIYFDMKKTMVEAYKRHNGQIYGTGTAGWYIDYDKEDMDSGIVYISVTVNPNIADDKDWEYHTVQIEME